MKLAGIRKSADKAIHSSGALGPSSSLYGAQNLDNIDIEHAILITA